MWVWKPAMAERVDKNASNVSKYNINTFVLDWEYNIIVDLIYISQKKRFALRLWEREIVCEYMDEEQPC